MPATNGTTTSTPPEIQGNFAHFPQSVGILAIEQYFPSEYVDQVELEQHDGVSAGKYTIGLGQSKMGFCSDREDVNSLCLTVTQRLLEKTGISPKDVGFLMVGTETLIDKSKSTKTTLMQLFQESGNTDIVGLHTTNACYGGTAALIHAVNWVESSMWDGRFAIVVAGDNAIYAAGPARPTGGAGAVAMLVGPGAPLVMDRGVFTTHMEDAYDFYKPDLSSEYATVDGQMTIKCYLSALDICYNRFLNKYEQVTGLSKMGHQVTMEDFDGMLFHAPYGKLIQKSVARLRLLEFLRAQNPDYENEHKGLENYRNVKLDQTYNDRDLEKILVALTKDVFEKKTKPSLLLSNQVGNSYTASLYSSLTSYLISKPINDLVDKRIALFSYGSGLAASMYSISIRGGPGLERLIDGIKDVPQRLADRIKVHPKDFHDCLASREKTHHLAPYTPTGKIDNLFPGTFYLTSVDSMYRRKYDRKPLVDLENNNNNVKSICSPYHVAEPGHGLTNGVRAAIA